MDDKKPKRKGIIPQPDTIIWFDATIRADDDDLTRDMLKKATPVKAKKPKGHKLN